MIEILTVLRNHKKLYPLMQFEDIYKLIFQHCYGPKHMAMSAEIAKEFIKKEAINCAKDATEIVDIGNDYIRVSITNNDEMISKLTDAFVKTIDNCNESLNFKQIMLNNKVSICELFNIEEKEYKEKILFFETQNFPPISHSDVYKANYFPHYRVVKKEYYI